MDTLSFCSHSSTLKKAPNRALFKFVAGRDVCGRPRHGKLFLAGKRNQQCGPSSAPVAIWGRRNDARADRNVRLQPITSISPPMFNFEHRLISWSRYPNQEVACLKGTTVVNFCEVVNIDQYLGQRGWKLVGITARQRHLSVTGSVVLPP